MMTMTNWMMRYDESEDGGEWLDPGVQENQEGSDEEWFYIFVFI